MKLKMKLYILSLTVNVLYCSPIHTCVWHLISHKSIKYHAVELTGHTANAIGYHLDAIRLCFLCSGLFSVCGLFVPVAGSVGKEIIDR